MKKNQRYKDQAKNAFAKTNLFYASGPFLGIQDPTVFGFKLFFHFNNIDSPLLWGINGDIQKIIDELELVYNTEKLKESGEVF